MAGLHFLVDADERGVEQRAAVAVQHLFRHRSRSVMHHELRGHAISGIHRVNQVDDVGIAPFRGLAGRPGYSESGGSDDAGRLARAGADGEVSVLDAAEADAKGLRDERLHVEGGILNEFDGDQDKLRGVFIGPERDLAERHFRRGLADGRVFRH
jgi:hypothetical protein